MGLSRILNISTSVDLTTRPLDASGPVSELKGMTPDEFATQLGPSLAQQFGVSLEDLDFQALNLPVIGDVAAGFVMKIPTEGIDFEGYLVSFARGRVSAELFVLGPADLVLPEDVASLADLIDRKIQENSP